MVVVVNRITLTVPVEELADDVQREFGPVFRTLAGFERYYFIIVWDTAEQAQARAQVIGPTLFNRIIAPRAVSQDRAVGPVLASDTR